MSMPFKYRVQNWVSAWVDLSAALVRIVTFGYYYPNWEMRIRAVWTKKQFAAWARRKTDG